MTPMSGNVTILDLAHGAQDRAGSGVELGIGWGWDSNTSEYIEMC